MADADTGVARTSEPRASGEELDERKLAVLRAIVTEFVAAGEPVGSRRVVEVAELGVSPATVRNDMVVLEELGYITQPHTSAGRVPTDAGYRYFVDELRQDPQIDEPHREVVGEMLGNARDVEDLLRRTSTVLSQLTRLVALVVAPAADVARVKLVELVGLTPMSALLLVVADTGRVSKRLLELSAPTTESDIERVRSVLRDHLVGRLIADIAAAADVVAVEAPSELRDLAATVRGALQDIEADDPVRQVFVGGGAQLAEDRRFKRGQLSRLLELLEERTTLARVLAESTLEDTPSVRIGDEVDVEGLQTTALVAQRYRLVTTGSLGVLGPMWMDYASVLATVRAVADQLDRTLTDLSD